VIRELKRISRWLSLRWRLKARYWQRRAMSAERQLKAEMWRNRAREDELITVPQRIQGLWGMPARTGPAMKNVSRETSRQLTQPNDPWDGLSWAEKQEYEMFWKADAAAAGVPEHLARQQFLAEMQSRKIPINDEPFS